MMENILEERCAAEGTECNCYVGVDKGAKETIFKQ